MEYQTTINALIVSAIAAGVYHTLIGPDHYLPFVALGKARGWSYSKTVLATSLCGVGHVASSVVIGLAGIAIGSAVGVLEALEGARADIVKWLLLLFAVAYTAYGIRRALCPPVHKHADGTVHFHCDGESGHSHSVKISNSSTFWVVFIIFAFGPCEILIPHVMYPASQFDWAGVVYVSLAFSIATISTMIFMVTFCFFGLRFVPIDFAKFARWNHAISGVVISMCAGLMFAGL